MALLLVAWEFGLRPTVASGQPFGPLEAHHGVVPALLGVLALMEARAERLAQRDLVTRELHDSIGRGRRPSRPRSWSKL